MTVKAFAIGVALLCLVAMGSSALGAAGRFAATLAAAAPVSGPTPVDLAQVLGPIDRPHHDYPALDLGLPLGAPVRSMIAGTVRLVGGSCGNGLQVTGAEGAVKFCHGERLHVTEGDEVAAGQLVMDAGATGRADPPGYVHLHIELRAPGDSRDAARCPQPYVRALASGAPPPALADLPTGGCTS